MLHVAGFQLIPYALQEKKIFSSKEKFGVDRQCTKYIQVIVCAQIRVSNTELKLLNKFLNFFLFFRRATCTANRYKQFFPSADKNNLHSIYLHPILQNYKTHKTRKSIRQVK